jgi:hypothetical protein
MTHKEFFTWLEGYLQGKDGDKFVDPRPIVEKMSNVKGVDPFFPEERKIIIKQPFDPIQIPTPKNPFDITCKTNLDD